MAAYTQDIDRCLERHIGDGGLSDAAFAAVCQAAGGASVDLLAEVDEGRLALANGLQDQTGLERAIAAGEAAFGDVARIIIVGTGGSSLGAKALVDACGATNGKTLIFAENPDPDSLSDLTADLSGTGVLAISKSGATAEVMAHLALLWQAATEQLGGEVARGRFVILTGPSESPMRAFAAARSLPVIPHDPDLGGRFSAFSPVVLLPAHLAGVDVSAVVQAAAEILDDLRSNGGDSAPAQGAAAMVGLMQAGRKVAVLVPYADRLRQFSRWFCQLWAESLGKAGQGAIPYPAVGAVDQHSQLQIWLDGPDIASFTLLGPSLVPGRARPLLIDTGGSAPELDGRSLADLIDAQYQGTADSLAAHGRPVRTFDMAAGATRARDVGGLMMHFMLETIIAGRMMGIDPFDQPAVEDGKQRTRKYLSGA
jgi:glucose-6-phosphate isomerase